VPYKSEHSHDEKEVDIKQETKDSDSNKKPKHPLPKISFNEEETKFIMQLIKRFKK
jgi:hypothetical protein